jgi:hypothetical protein
VNRTRRHSQTARSAAISIVAHGMLGSDSPLGNARLCADRLSVLRMVCCLDLAEWELRIMTKVPCVPILEVGGGCVGRVTHGCLPSSPTTSIRIPSEPLQPTTISSTAHHLPRHAPYPHCLTFCFIISPLHGLHVCSLVGGREARCIFGSGC